MPKDLFILHSSTDSAASRTRLHDALAAHAGFERARSLREMALFVVAVLGAPVWLAAVRPDWMSPVSRRLALALWMVAAIGLLLSFASERSWQRRCVRAVTGRRENRPAA